MMITVTELLMKNFTIVILDMDSALHVEYFGSPVWCMCGYKQLSDGWTSNNKQLDDFIKASQLKTNSPNDAYLEWILFDYICDNGYGSIYIWMV